MRMFVRLFKWSNYTKDSIDGGEKFVKKPFNKSIRIRLKTENNQAYQVVWKIV